MVGEDIVNFIKEFHSNAKLPKATTASFLALISNKDHPQVLESRPISLICSLYKILGKILARRLKKELGKLITKSQNAFLPGRQIQYGVLLVNEALDSK